MPAQSAWGRFTAAFEAAPQAMNQHWGDGFCATYRDVNGDEVRIYLKQLELRAPAKETAAHA